MRDPYAILGVARNADDKTIKAAFLSRLKEHHPDLNPGDATAAERFRDITSAYELLRSPQRRRAVDQSVTLIGRASKRRDATGRKKNAGLRIGLTLAAAAGAVTLGALVVSKPGVDGDQPSVQSRAQGQDVSRFAFDPRLRDREGPPAGEAPELDDTVLSRWTPRFGALFPPTPSATSDDEVADRPGSPTREAPTPIALSKPLEPVPQEDEPEHLADTAAIEAPTPQPPSAAPALPAQAEPPPLPKSASPKPLDPKWATHLIAKTGLMLRVPASIFTVHSPQDDASGRIYATADGRAVLRIVSADNPYALSADAIRRHIASTRYAGASFEGRTQHPNAIVLSGKLGSEQFHDVTILSCDGNSMHGWHVVFPVEDDELFSPLIADMSRAFLTDRPHGFRCTTENAASSRPRAPRAVVSGKSSHRRNVATSSGQIPSE